MRVIGPLLGLASLAATSACGGSGSHGGVDGGADVAVIQLPPLPLKLPEAGHATGTRGTGTSGATSHGTATSGGPGVTASSGGTGTVTSHGGPPTTLTVGTTTLTLTVAGMSRTAVLYVPASATSTAPLVLALHGDGDTDTNFVATSGLQGLADSRGFVLVAPQGITRDIMVDGQTVPQVDWDAYTPASSGNVDVALLEQLRMQLQGTHQVDPSHTFVFGYSQGGYMSFLYGLSDATVLSCAGVLAASSPYGGGAGDPLISGAPRKIPVALQIGSEDGAFSAAEATEASLKAAGFPVQFNAIAGAGHVPIPGDISVPLAYCLGQSL